MLKPWLLSDVAADLNARVIGADVAFSAVGTDSRTIARKTLDAIEAAILKIHQANAAGRVGAITEWSAEGLSIKRENQADLLAELQKQRDRWAAIVRTQEDRAKLKLGRATGRRILTRFVPTT